MFRAVLSSLVGWLMMLGIMAGMVRMDSYALAATFQGWYCWWQCISRFRWDEE